MTIAVGLGRKATKQTKQALVRSVKLFTGGLKLVSYSAYILSAYHLCSKQASRYEWVLENYFLYFSSKTYVVGTQKNCLNET